MKRKTNKKTTQNTEQQTMEEKPLQNFSLPPQDMGVEMVVFSLSEVNRMINKGQLEIPKDFQREEVYTDAQKQSLIESAILRKPIPALFLYQQDKNIKQYLIIDGQQRFTAFRDLFTGELLFNSYDPRVKELNGYSYPDLPEEIRDEIKDIKLHFQVITGTGIAGIQRYYTLLNSTSQPLSPGELFYAVPNPAHKFFQECFNMRIINKVGNYKRKPKWVLIARLFFLFVEGDIAHNLYIGKPTTTMLRYFNSVDNHTMSDLWNKVQHLLNTVANAVGDCTMPRGADQMFNWICAIGHIAATHDVDQEQIQSLVTYVLTMMNQTHNVHPDYQEDIKMLEALHNSASMDKVNLFATTLEKLYCEGGKVWGE